MGNKRKLGWPRKTWNKIADILKKRGHKLWGEQGIGKDEEPFPQQSGGKARDKYL